MMEQQQQAPQKQQTLQQKAYAIGALAMYPALTLMVFTRHKLGYRFLDPVKLMIMWILVSIFGGVTILFPTGTHTLTSAPYAGGYTQSVTVANGSPTASYTPLILFAFVMFAAGMIERYIRFQDIKKGVAWHTYSRGVSWISYRLPNVPDSIVKRFIEPAALALIGFLVSLLPFHWLGYYIIFAAVCMYIFEVVDHERLLDRMLDTLDGMVDGEVMSDNVEYYSQPEPKQRPLDQTAGIPTGIAPDIEAQIQKRRRNRTIPVDNLATPQPVTQHSYNRPIQ